MEVNESLTSVSETSILTEASGCPKCEEPLGGIPAVEVGCFGSVRIRRCLRCGTRSTMGESVLRIVRTCEGCGQAFLDAAVVGQVGGTCPSCDDEQLHAVTPDPDVTVASETEMEAALDSSWTFVTCRELGDYLDGVLGRLASRIPGVPPTRRVVLIEEHALRTLALPSGTVLMSLGMLDFLADEAELAFVLAHELAHIASGQVAGRLVQTGFVAVARDGNGNRSAWVEAATDLIRLGYGRQIEQEADLRALDAILALGYDPESALRFLRRLHASLESGDKAAADVAAGHPSPAYRIRKLERSLYGRPERDQVQRVNREVFRRATKVASISGYLIETHLVGPAGVAGLGDRPGNKPWLLWAAAAAATLALGTLVVRLVL